MNKDILRLVGDTPEDLINQLDVSELNLNHVSYYGESIGGEGNNFIKKDGALKAMFNDYEIKSYWDFNSVDVEEFESNELFIIESLGEATPSTVKSERLGSTLYPSSIKGWRDDFAEHYPVFIFDSKYAGLAIPKEASFILPTTRYAQTFAPSFTNSRTFVKALICNLGDGKTIGNTFREARNKYYENTKPSWSEPIGLTLMSYNSYGNPLAITKTQKYDKEELEDYCGDLLGKKEAGFGGLDFENQDVPEKITEVVNIDYSTTPLEDFEVIEVEDGINFYEHFELVKPLLAKQHALPKNAFIESFNYEFSDPVELALDLPEYQNALVDRGCYYEKENASVELSKLFKEDKQLIRIDVSPLEVVDCNSGSFKLYQYLYYEIEYGSYSPLFFETIEYPEQVKPGDAFEVDVNLKYVNNAAISGEIEVYYDSELILQQELSSKLPFVTVPVIAKAEEGVGEFVVKFIQNEEVLVESSFEVEIRLLDYWLEIPELVQGDTTIVLNVLNYAAVQKDLLVQDNMLLN